MSGHLLVVGLLAFLTGQLVIRVIVLELTPEHRTPARAAPLSTPPASRPRLAWPKPDPGQITARNLFCSRCRHDAAAKVSEPEEPPPPALEAAELLATAISPQDPRGSTATIRLADTGRVRVVAVGSFLRRVVITDIDPSTVTYQQRGRDARIGYRYPKRRPPRRVKRRRRPPRRPKQRRRPKPLSPWQRELAQGIRRVGTNRYHIARSLMQKVGAQPALLAREMAVRPFLERGHVAGYQLRRVRPGSALARMGLRSGDVLRAVNNQPLTSPDRVLGLYSQLPSARHVTIGISRRGRPLSLDYTIQ